MSRLFIFIQIAGCFSAYGILTNDSLRSMKIIRSGSRLNNRSSSWQNVLREATFQSLIKHTGFTPSLDQKLETDRILWEKIQSARFLRRQGKHNETQKIKTGVLVDMTPENGQLEFRQSDKSVYNCDERKCQPVPNRLLAVWKMQKFEPNDIWIRIKMIRISPFEDIYEFTPKFGLKEINIPQHFYSNIMKLQHSANVNENYSNSKDKINRQDKRLFDMEDLIKHLMKAQSFIYDQPKVLSYSTVKLHNSAAPPNIPIIEGLSAPPISKDDLWKKEHSSISKEFEINGKVYDGFLPSMGPTGTPLKLSHSINFHEEYPEYLQAKTNTKNINNVRVQKYFKPSIQFIQYSDVDPLYHNEENTESSSPSEKYLKSEAVFPSSINDQLAQLKPTEKVHNSNNFPYENNATPTASTIKILQVTEKEGGPIFLTDDVSSLKVSTTNRPKLKSFLHLRSYGLSNVTSTETYDYAPLYLKWGDKIKTTNNKNKTSNQGYNIPYQNPFLKNKQIYLNESTQVKPLISFRSNSTNEINNTTVHLQENISESISRKLPLNNDSLELSNKTKAESSSTNLIIENIKDKSPEEIVNTLTTIGVHNSSRIEGYPAVSAELASNSNRLIDKLKHRRDGTTAINDPLSVIINRISQSFSYKTSKGKEYYVKKLLEHES